MLISQFTAATVAICFNEVDTLPAVGTEIICLGVMVRVGVRFRVWVRISSLRDSFSVLLLVLRP